MLQIQMDGYLNKTGELDYDFPVIVDSPVQKGDINGPFQQLPCAVIIQANTNHSPPQDEGVMYYCTLNIFLFPTTTVDE